MIKTMLILMYLNNFQLTLHTDMDSCIKNRDKMLRALSNKGIQAEAMCFQTRIDY